MTERRHVIADSFHTLFLSPTTKSRGYRLVRGEEKQREEVLLAGFVTDVISSSLAQFF
ncbi:MAG: hypothetical protein OXF88_06975 [Rhodobacteraceae bacterium]|nr:hypothetical protein [Paracoccaceae bacterium]